MTSKMESRGGRERVTKSTEMGLRGRWVRVAEGMGRREWEIEEGERTLVLQHREGSTRWGTVTKHTYKGDAGCHNGGMLERRVHRVGCQWSS